LAFSAITMIAMIAALAFPTRNPAWGVDHTRAFDQENNRDHRASSKIPIIGRDKLNIEITEREKIKTPSLKVPSGRSPPGTLAFVP
jgi:hypothetical protein